VKGQCLDLKPMVTPRSEVLKRRVVFEVAVLDLLAIWTSRFDPVVQLNEFQASSLHH
jgi:hypothetical protein